ncbi:MAG: YibE/F-like protein [candidate division WS6 bacterium OLB20]|uniref:YibE/F-like protein n=1 Tax=candidate division WS6 bacterium OLB20 TaxID=1617426 RepID=A0A136LVP0_9BACT|nr:MAG: YibE/F-like protein [candidate division WS6 bacterium OLB20]
MQKLKQLLTRDALIALILTLLVGAVSLFSISRQEPSSSLQSASITDRFELIEDGGQFYQNVEARLDSNGEFISLRIPVRDVELEQINQGDLIYVEDVQTSIGEFYRFAGHARSNILLWVSIVFFALMAVILGKEGFKYIVPTLLVFLLTFSGALGLLFELSNIFIMSLLALGIIAFASMLIQVRNIRIAFIVSISQVLTLFIILLINVMLFKSTFLTELFYTNVSLISGNTPLADFWNLINVAVLFISFGATINTALDVAQSIIRKKKTYPKTTTINLVREGTAHNQIAVGRVVNSFFFVFLGITITSIMLSKGSALPFWEDPYVVQGMLWFMSASFAALLVGPVTAVITAISLTADTPDIQLSLRERLQR